MPSSLLPLLVEPSELADCLKDKRLLVVDMSLPGVYNAGHIPGAVRLDYPRILYSHDNTDCDIPTDEILSKALSAIGLTPEHHVVAYDGQGNPMACRLLWTLEELGHKSYSLLNGGAVGWANAGFNLEQATNTPVESDYHAKRKGFALATKDHILSRIGKTNVVLLDTRTQEEFNNELVITDRGGKIPGAVHFDWLDAINEENGKRLQPKEQLVNMLGNIGVHSDKEVIPYCQTHLRSAHTYFVLKYLGYSNVFGYAAGYSEWGNDPKTPIENEQRAA